MTKNADTQFDTISSHKSWFNTWLEAFGDTNCGIWYANNKNLVLIPYCKKRMQLGPLSISIAASATNDHTPRYDIIGKLKDPAYSFNKMMQHLRVHALSFSYVSHSSRLFTSIENNPLNLFYFNDFCEVSPYVDCTIDWDTYWQSRGKTKATWRRREKKLIDDLGAQFRCITTWEEAKTLLPTIYDIEASGWKGQEGTAIKQNKDVLLFYNKIAKVWSNENALRLFVLSLNDQIIAFQLNAEYNRVLYHVKVGFLDEYAKLSPGQALQVQILRWAFANTDIDKFDLLGGGGKAAETKMKWATHIETLFTTYVFKRSFAGFVIWLRIVLAPNLKRRLLRKKPKQPPMLTHPV